MIDRLVYFHAYLAAVLRHRLNRRSGRVALQPGSGKTTRAATAALVAYRRKT